MSNVTIYCNSTDCKRHDGTNCSADYTTIENGECLGYEQS